MRVLVISDIHLKTWIFDRASRASGVGLCGAGSITLSGGKGRTRETKDQESGSKFIKVYGKSR